jgi:Ser/Thr protein kinase RdoA (MazF antagonist)
LWDLQHFPRLRPLLAHIEDADARVMLERVLDRFDAEAAPALGAMRTQVIHNDLNPHNVVVDAAGSVSGIIDFGDMVRAPLVCDVAVAAAYHVRADGAALADASDYVVAFHAETPLQRSELELLPLLIEARLAMTALITNWRASLYPQNRAYILRNAPTAWAGLNALSAAPARLEITP